MRLPVHAENLPDSCLPDGQSYSCGIIRRTMLIARTHTHFAAWTTSASHFFLQKWAPASFWRLDVNAPESARIYRDLTHSAINSAWSMALCTLDHSLSFHPAFIQPPHATWTAATPMIIDVPLGRTSPTRAAAFAVANLQSTTSFQARREKHPSP